MYQTLVLPQLNDFMGQVFEEMCKQYLFLPDIYQILPFPIGEIGRWWGNNPKARRQEENYFLIPTNITVFSLSLVLITQSSRRRRIIRM